MKLPESEAFEEGAGKRGLGGRCRKARLWREVLESEAFEDAGKRGFGGSAGKRGFGGR